ncbi:sulfatase [Labilibacter marinus]|uniref:sulfatase n=1 Tax=Labilibacter marinus TaxID=1477105 RepID=UPI0009F982AA|nr:sulfatase [Labilibacter marinus]
MKNIFIAIISLSLICSSCDSKTKETPSKKPNIVFILVDDLGHADVGFNGSKYYETPHIDELANNGLVLENSYMYPTCSPSRAAIFTGKQSFRTNVYTVPVLEKGTDQESIFSRWTVGLEHPLHAELMQKEGYKSIHLGKYHIVGPYPEEEVAMDYPFESRLTQPDPWDFSWLENHRSPEVMKYYPERRGFVKNVGGTYRGDPALEIGGYKSETGGYSPPYSNPFLPENKNESEWLTDLLTSEAIDFIDQHKEEPFFVNLNYYTVHRPIRRRSEELFEKYMDKAGDEVTGQGVEGKRKEKMAEYASMIESLDNNVQRIVEYLNNSGLRENTVIIFSSDNGYHGIASDNRLMRGKKGYIYEGGIRVPTLINWPGKVNARRSKVAVSCLDYYPTFIDLAGVKDYEGPMDGNSMVPLFNKDNELFKSRPLFWHLASICRHGTCSVIRKNDYKLIQYLEDGKLELYNLVQDPQESFNLADKEKSITQQMLNELVQWRKTNNVPLPPNSILKL